VHITINGTQYEVRGESTVLEVAQREGIEIPTLCHHPALEPYGACRLCLVEVKAGGRPGLTASCALPVSKGLVVETDSPRVKHVRQIVMKLIMAACPDTPAVLELAEKLGVTETPYEKASMPNSCVLCGACVRICNKVGSSAIGFAYRGSQRRVMGPFDKVPDACLGCRACENVCPMGLISFEEKDGVLVGDPFKSRVTMAKCPQCGKFFTGAPMLNTLESRVGLAVDLCPECQKAYEARLILESNGAGKYFNINK
jgi:bidirectional [NiFe] hydrogenase diaphorase subunit